MISQEVNISGVCLTWRLWPLPPLKTGVMGRGGGAGRESVTCSCL